MAINLKSYNISKYVSSHTSKKQIFAVALQHYIKSDLTDFIRSFLTDFHKSILNVFSEIFSTPYPSFKKS